MRRPSRQALFVATLSCTLWSCGGIDPGKLRPGGRTDAGPDAASPPCPGFAAPPAATSSYSSAAGDWTLVLPERARHTALTISGAQPGQAAVAADWDEAVGDLAGLVVSRPSTTVDAFDETWSVLEAVASDEDLKGATLFSSGTLGRAPDGRSRVANALLELHKGSTTAVYRVRNLLYPRLLQLNIAQLPNLPETPGETGDGFVVAIGSTLRSDGRAAISVGVATRDSFLSRDTKTRILAADLAGGTALGPRSGSLRPRCDEHTLPAGGIDAVAPTVLGKADVIWVVSGGVAASEVRTRLHGAVVAFWNRARSAGLDLRMAVAPIGDASGAILCQAKGCAGPFSTEQELAGCFQPCVLEPAGANATGEQGLETARLALIAALPRTAGSLHKLRPGATAAVVFVSDAEDGGAAALFGGRVPSPPLSEGDRQRLDAHLRPLLDLLAGRPNPQNELPTDPGELAGSRAYAIVPYPIVESATQTCGRRMGLAYARAALLAGGSFATLCADKNDDDLAVGLGLIAEELAGRACGVPLPGAPVAASLAAAANSDLVYRSTGHGFDYVASANALVYFRAERARGTERDLWVRGARVEVGYLSW
jgi:hypothetical protein